MRNEQNVSQNQYFFMQMCRTLYGREKHKTHKVTRHLSFHLYETTRKSFPRPKCHPVLRLEGKMHKNPLTAGNLHWINCKCYIRSFAIVVWKLGWVTQLNFSSRRVMTSWEQNFYWLYLVSGVAVPHNQFPVLRGTNQKPAEATESKGLETQI